MTPTSQPLAEISEFTLPGRVKELAAKILGDLITPCRMQLANAEKKQSDAIMLADQAMASAKNGADQAMASAEAKFRTVRDEQNSKLQRIQSRVSSGVGELNQICATAGQH